MYDDVQDSDDIKADNTVLNPVLPNPDVRVQVVKADNGHTYEYSLNNLEDYSGYPDWQVQVTVQRVGTIILDAQHPTGNMNVTITNVNDLVYQMVAKSFDQSWKQYKSRSLTGNIYTCESAVLYAVLRYRFVRYN